MLHMFLSISIVTQSGTARLISNIIHIVLNEQSSVENKLLIVKMVDA